MVMFAKSLAVFHNNRARKKRLLLNLSLQKAEYSPSDKNVWLSFPFEPHG